MNRADYLANCKTVRAYIAANPGKTRKEIEAATGVVGTLMTLTMHRLVRLVRLVRVIGRPPRYFVEAQ